MDRTWDQVAERIVDALDVRAGELIQLRDLAGRLEVTQEVLVAIERRGATPLLQLLPPTYLARLLTTTEPKLLADWDRHRQSWLEATDRIVVLAGVMSDLEHTPPAARAAWHQAVERLTRDEERRCIPCVLVAIPTAQRAEQRGYTSAELDRLIIPALSASPVELAAQANRLLGRLSGAAHLTIQSGRNCALSLDITGRRWLSDTGELPAAERLPPGTQAVLNLPSGAVYTTVVEAATHGQLWLPEAAGARDVVLWFEGGRVVRIEAAHGAAELEALFAQHTGESRRISHIGIGLNPSIERTIGWPLVDEHRQGALIIAFGENRYLGGQNESSLNIDFVLPSADLLAEQRAIVKGGQLVAEDA
jgi:leucyl aminopeptidase (aminopeptidase T)